MTRNHSSTISFQVIKLAAAGRWPEILTAFGISALALSGKHGPCPGCGGKDRFRYAGGDDGQFFCGQGGVVTGGDGFSLLEHMGYAKADALKAVAQYLGIGIENRPLSSKQYREIQKRKLQVHSVKLDDAIYHECHILMQTTGSRIASRQLKKNRKFRAARPEWHPQPETIWERELLAAKRLAKALRGRYAI